MKLNLLAAAALLVACDTVTDNPDYESQGTLQASLQMGPVADWARLDYKVVAAVDECDAAPVASARVSLTDTPDFADAFFELDAGQYRVCVTPTPHEGVNPSSASVNCSAIEGLFRVDAGQTTEGMLTPECAPEEDNDAPYIAGLSYSPSKFISACESVTLRPSGRDPKGDPVAFDWEVLDAPGQWRLDATPTDAVFHGTEPGTYTLQVNLTDAKGASDYLVFPIHVHSCDVPPGAIVDTEAQRAYLVTEPVGRYTSAKAVAEAYGGTLVTIDSEHEQAFIDLGAFGANCWSAISEADSWAPTRGIVEIQL